MYLMVMTSTNDIEIATNLSQLLVQSRYTPCVQILENLQSTYIWNGKIVNEGEVVIFIKTTKNNLNHIVETIKNNHNYECPEIISYKINIENNKYEEWFKDNIKEK